jgi:hypothetical protein
MEYIN